MPTRYTQHVQKRAPQNTPQSQPIPGSSQVANSAGGYSFAADRWQRLRRFLILGSELGTYYIGERELTRENAKNVEACIAEGVDGAARVLHEITEVSTRGLAPKQEPTLFALALLFTVGDADIKRRAAMLFPSIARTGTHLFTFLEMCKALRGWGRSLRTAVRNWYASKPADELAYQLIKYPSRGGWSHRDALRLSHVKPIDERQGYALTYAVKGIDALEAGTDYPAIFAAVERTRELGPAMRSAVRAPAIDEVARLIALHNLPREALATELLNEPAVWRALLERMPYTALVRNLGNLTKHGIVDPFNAAPIVEKITNRETIAKSRIHPMQLIIAQLTYGQGKGMRGSSAWTPAPAVVDALGDAAVLAFPNVTPSGKRILYAVDVSGSMSSGHVAGLEFATCAQMANALALIGLKTEPNVIVVDFDTLVRPSTLSKSHTLAGAMRLTRNGGGTDCAAPINFASANRGLWKVDAIVLLTDSETWAGNTHPVQAMQRYRRDVNPNARLVIMALQANRFTVAPDDPLTLNVAGLDASAPAIVSQFIAGEL